MKYITIGNSGLQASAVALGCMRIAEIQPSEITRLIEKAMEAGINFFDHADIYGGGKSEELFGRIIKDTPSIREKMLIQSKCGIRKGMFDFSKEHILTSADNILTRLNTDYLDVLLLHRPDTLMEPEEVAEAFRRLHESGKVRHFGVSNMNPVQIELLQQALEQPLVANQLQFSAAHTGIIDAGLNVNMTVPGGIVRDGGILEYCRLKKITIQTWSSLQYGFFGGTFLNSDKYPELNAVLNRIAEEKRVTAAAVAIAWILRHPAGMQAVIGSTSPERVAQMAKSVDVALDRAEWYEIYRSAGNQLP